MFRREGSYAVQVGKIRQWRGYDFDQPSAFDAYVTIGDAASPAEDALRPSRPIVLNLPQEPSFKNCLQTPSTIHDQHNEYLATNHLIDDPVGLDVDLSMGLDT